MERTPSTDTSRLAKTLAGRWLDVRRRTSARLWRALEIRRRHYLDQTDLGMSERVLDIVTLLAPKDLPVFRCVMPMARAQLLHPVGRHYVIAPDDADIRAACASVNTVFVDEATVFGSDYPSVRSRVAAKVSQPGWVLQQLLKLGADRIADHNDFLVLDADTCFVTPARFHWDGAWLLDYNRDFQRSYDAFAARLLGWGAIDPQSFVCHYMVMNRQRLRELRARIEAVFERPWVDAIIDHLDPGQPRNFSEYQLYANFLLAEHPAAYRKGFAFNVACEAEDRSPEAIERACLHLRGQAKSASFHLPAP